MKMLAFLVFGSLLVSCGGGGGISSAGIPEAEACSQASTAVCAKLYGCTGSSITIARLLLMNEAACKTTVLQYCGSTGFQCTGGATYHGDQAQICKDKFNAQTCAALDVALSMATSTTAAIAAVTANVMECANICTGGTDAGGAG